MFFFFFLFLKIISKKLFLFSKPYTVLFMNRQLLFFFVFVFLISCGCANLLCKTREYNITSNKITDQNNHTTTCTDRCFLFFSFFFFFFSFSLLMRFIFEQKWFTCCKGHDTWAMLRPKEMTVNQHTVLSYNFFKKKNLGQE